MSVTYTYINKLEASDKCLPNRPDKHSDGDRHTGNKVWVSTYRWQGKQQTLTLGKYPSFTLQNARKRNLEIKQLISEGTHPKENKKEQTAKQDGTRLLANIRNINNRSNFF